MSEQEEFKGGDLPDAEQRKSGPGPGNPTGETLSEEAVPAGEAELAKDDVGFGPTDGDEQVTDEEDESS